MPFIFAAATACSGGCLSGCLSEIAYQGIADFLSGKKRAKEVKAKVASQLLSGLDSGALVGILKGEEWVKVKQKAQADLSKGLADGSLGPTLHKENLKSVEELKVRTKAKHQLSSSLDNKSLPTALSMHLLEESLKIKQKLQDLLSEGLLDGSLNRSLRKKNLVLKEREEEVRAQLESHLLFGLDCGTLGGSLNVHKYDDEKWSKVKHKIRAGFSKGLDDGSLVTSLCKSTHKANEEAKVQLQVKTKLQSQLLGGYASGTLSELMHPSPLRVQQKLKADLAKAVQDGSLRSSLSFRALRQNEHYVMGA